MIGFAFKGEYYGMGSKFGVLKANVEYGLRNEEVGEKFYKYLKSLKL